MGLKSKFAWSAVFLFIVAGFVAIPVALALTRPPLIDTANCRSDGVVPAHSVVLIDQSDPFEDSDVEWVWQLIFDESKRIAKYGRLTVLGINADDPDQGIQVFSRCSPGSPTVANPLYENPRFIEADWKGKFEEEMKRKVSDLMLTKQAPRSPLAEHIRGIVRRVDFQHTVAERTIIIVSDLHQNSDGWSHYKSGVQVEPFLHYLEGMEFPELAGVDFRLFRVDRDSPLKPAALREFWIAALTHFKAGSVEFIRD